MPLTSTEAGDDNMEAVVTVAAADGLKAGNGKCTLLVLPWPL